ncbi:MAG: exopolysaccharide biosynthesis protein [Cyanobacteria bacterium P01_F01_bin.86]
MARLSAELEQFFFDESRGAKVTLADILNLSGERTFGFLFVLLALPSALPIPAPGYSIPFGVVMFVLSMQLVIGRQRPWLPAGWQKKGFELKQVQKVIKAGSPWLRRIESLSRPRLTMICTSHLGRVFIGLGIALMSTAMMIPIPGTNTLPAIGIFVTGFGLLDDDGAISLAGLTICAMGITLTTLIVIFGPEAVKAGIEWIRQAIF